MTNTQTNHHQPPYPPDYAYDYAPTDIAERTSRTVYAAWLIGAFIVGLLIGAAL